MCGIAGVWGAVNEAQVREMMMNLTHRGPDAEGLFVDRERSSVFGHRRLSIMDPEGGNQPIFNEQKTGVIIANGEIYNFPQLLPTLSATHTLATTSDSEAILHLFEDKGASVVDILDGMYAFAIIQGGEFFAARDPIGIKPLYYSITDDSFYFASELKALASRCDVVKEFPPGTTYSSIGGFSTFYSVPDILPQEAPAELYRNKIRQTLEATVLKRLMSDVPLGAFLSGGLDSSIIAALAYKHMGALHTFSVGIEGCRDLEAARLVSRHLGTTHHEYVITRDEVIEKLPEIIYYLESFDQDLVRSAIPCYFTSRLASNYVKVILTGEGADELFAGYTYYKDIRAGNHLHSELRRSVASLHNINLQRVDRMTMAHSIEGRVPFLDLQMIELGQTIPVDMKLPAGSPPVEKWILRQAFADLLPAEITWRRKEQFDEGSGTVDLLDTALQKAMSRREADNYRRRHSGVYLRSSEECYYHRIFTDVFAGSENMQANVARWAQRPENFN